MKGSALFSLAANTVQGVVRFEEGDKTDLPTFDMCALMSIKVNLVIDTRCPEPHGCCWKKIREKTRLGAVARTCFPTGQKSWY
jgi:hypothetical protein